MFNLKFDSESFAKVVLFALIGFTPLYLTACRNGLFADGSYFIYNLLTHKDFRLFHEARTSSLYLSQFMVLATMKAGISDREVLYFIHSFNLLSLPALLWGLGLYRSRSELHFWPLVCLYGVVYLNSGFFSIGEYNLAFALFGLAFSILLRTAKLSPIDILLLLLSSWFLIRSYEATAFLAPLLVLLVVRRIRHNKEPLVSKIFISLSGLLSLTAALVASYYILKPYSPQQLSHALKEWQLLDNPQFLISFGVLAIHFFSFLILSKSLRLVLKVTGIVLLAVLTFYPVLWALPEEHYKFRMPISLTLFAGAMGVAEFQRRSIKNFDFQLPLVLVLSLNLLMLFHGSQFSKFIRVFRSEVISRTGAVAMEDTKLKEFAPYYWVWAFPVLSELLRQYPENATILNPRHYRGWQPKL